LDEDRLRMGRNPQAKSVGMLSGQAQISGRLAFSSSVGGPHQGQAARVVRASNPDPLADCPPIAKPTVSRTPQIGFSARVESAVCGGGCTRVFCTPLRWSSPPISLSSLLTLERLMR